MSSKSEALKRIVWVPLMLFAVILFFMAMLSGAIVIYVGLFSNASTGGAMPVWCYRVIFVVAGSLMTAWGIAFWVVDVGPCIKEGLK